MTGKTGLSFVLVSFPLPGCVPTAKRRIYALQDSVSTCGFGCGLTGDELPEDPRESSRGRGEGVLRRVPFGL